MSANSSSNMVGIIENSIEVVGGYDLVKECCELSLTSTKHEVFRTCCGTVFRCDSRWFSFCFILRRASQRQQHLSSRHSIPPRPIPVQMPRQLTHCEASLPNVTTARAYRGQAASAQPVKGACLFAPATRSVAGRQGSEMNSRRSLMLIRGLGTRQRHGSLCLMRARPTTTWSSWRAELCQFLFFTLLCRSPLERNRCGLRVSAEEAHSEASRGHNPCILRTIRTTS